MGFAEKLNNLMGELGLSQTKLSELTGIGKSSICQYISGKNEPSEKRKRQMARALGVQENYFIEFPPVTEITSDPLVNLPIPLVAKLMRKSKGWVEEGLQQGCFPWGYAVKMKKWSYWVNGRKFFELEGIPVPADLNFVTGETDEAI